MVKLLRIFIFKYSNQGPWLKPSLHKRAGCAHWHSVVSATWKIGKVTFSSVSAQLSERSLFTCTCYMHASATSIEVTALCNVRRFYFLITYRLCKKRKYYNRMSEKKNSLLLMNVHVLYVLEDKTSTKKFPSVCLAVYLYVDCRWGHNNFRRS